MAHTKAQGAKASQKQNRAGKRRGVKHYGGEDVIAGNIIVRQVGTKFHPGDGVDMGKDFTIYAVRDGQVSFYTRRGKKYITVA